ncbi:MAG: exo-alpha-sialidase, partial [Geodermatophilaceae bacterium]|nr:exo-alpha-sialidase [Geodermatophilaceae bacterium]
MRTRAFVVAVAGVGMVAASILPSAAGDRPYGSGRLVVRPEVGAVGSGAGATTGGSGQFSKTQIERYRCGASAGSAYGTPAGAMDISCNDRQPYRQDFNPDNELAVAVNPKFPGHVLAGSNDYFYRFNNATGARQALVPTGFFTSFNAGRTWVDGQIPVRSGNGAGDPSPAFDRRLSGDSPRTGWAMMAQLENTGGQGGFFVSQGDVSVSYSRDGGVAWSEPVTVFKGTGTGIGPANRATFFDKEWLTVDNYPRSPHYGRAYLATTRFLNGRHGSYAESPIWLSYSDDGGRTWSAGKEISGSNPLCDEQSTGPVGECDESQFGIPEVAANGDLLVHFLNFNVSSASEVEGEFDSVVMVVKSTNGGRTFSDPVPVVSMEDGAADTPWSVIGRQTVTGHQLRWTAAGNIATDPTDSRHSVVVYADNFAGTHDARPASCLAEIPGTAPDYNPCGAVTATNIYMAESFDGGLSWAPRIALDARAGDAWFPWADFAPDGTLHVGYDSNENVDDPGNDRDDTFNHVLLSVDARTSSGPVSVLRRQVLVPDGSGRRPAEHIDESVTHWAGQYVPQSAWPAVCGPDGYSDPPVTDAEGKDCNVFHGDYTGLAVGSDGSVNVV